MANYDLKDDSVVVVIGSGAGGGTLSHELCQKGINVVLLEAGKRTENQDFVNDEWASFLQLAWLDPRTTSGSWRVAKDFSGLPAWICKTVGGTTVHWAGASLRLREHEFKAKTTYGAVKGANLLDWPVTLDELEPYYARAEFKMGVTRTNDIPGLPGNNNFKIMEYGAKKIGYQTVHTGRMAINSKDRDGRGACQQIGFCFQGCKSGAKWSTLYTEIPKAEATGRLDLRPQSHAVKISHDDTGKATGVVYADKDGKLQEQRARLVCVACNSIESPRLLLNSASTKYPDGLANSSGMVGKHLMFNQGAGVHAVFEHEINDYKSVQVTRILHDFYDADPKRGFYGGGGIDARINPQPGLWAMAAGGDLPTWGPEFKSRLEAFPRSTMSTGHCTSLPLETNSVSLDPSVKDAWGIPAIRVTYKDHPDDLATAKFLQDRSYEIMEAAGAQKLWRERVEENSGGAHLLGTCRMGDDPKTSVVDKYHRTHDVPNLFLCDGSSFVTSGRGQPTMTIQALAFRAGDYIGQFAKRNEI